MGEGVWEFPSWTEVGTAWRISVGAAVLDDLRAGIDAHVVGPKPRRSVPVALGVVYRFTSADIARALPDDTCVVVSKGAERDDGSRVLLERIGCGLTTGMLGLGDLGRRRDDGTAPMLGMDSEAASALEPVRVAGWGGGAIHTKPHAKVLVLGHHEFEMPWDHGYTTRTAWTRAWVGSANWTVNARSHAEFGLWLDDADLVRRFARFATEIVVASEPPSGAGAPPAPDLTEVEVPEPDWETSLLDEGDDW